MNRKDTVYQSAVDSEVETLKKSNFTELMELPFGTKYDFKFQTKDYNGQLCHLLPDTTSPFHSIVLLTERKMFLVYRKYLAGFSFNDNFEIFKIEDEILYSFD